MGEGFLALSLQRLEVIVKYIHEFDFMEIVSVTM